MSGKIYQLNSGSAPESKPSIGEYWRLWNAVAKVRPDANRIAITHRVLKHVPKATEMSEEQLGKMIRVFSAMLKSASKPKKPSVSSDSLVPSPQEETSAYLVAQPRSKRITAAALALGAERLRILNAAKPLLPGRTLEEVARMIGTNAPKLCRVLKKFSEIPENELSAERLAGDTAKCGRNSDFEEVASDVRVQQRLQQLYLLTLGASSDYMTKGRRTGSAAMTLERFADDELCPPDLAPVLRQGKQPVPLLKIIRAINAEIEQRQRGSKHSQNSGTLIHRRELIEILSDGSQVEINLGDWWVFDDMSTNSPFWFAGPENTPMVGRQGLYAYDIRRRWLGCELIGTSRDSYTAAIILRFLRRLMQVLGKPRRGIVFERSVWQARSIMGHRVTSTGRVVEDEFERPAMPEEEKFLLQDGIKALGIELFYTYTPRGKEIEGAFNYLQRVFPTFAPEAVNIGRHAGEFEHGAKQLRRAHAGSFVPESLGFLHIDAHAEVSEQAMSWINRREEWKGAKSSASDSVPPEAAYPQLAELTHRDMAAFLPRTHEVEIRGGKVAPKVASEPFEFTAPEDFAALGSGYRVFVKFDPSEPTIGAAIYNRDESSANFRGYQVGEFICWAEFLPAVPRFVFGESEAAKAAGDLKKRFNGFVRTAFRAVGMPKHKAATARDGRGNVVEIGNTPASPEKPAGRPVVESKSRIKFSQSPDEFKQQASTLSRQAARLRQLENQNK